MIIEDILGSVRNPTARYLDLLNHSLGDLLQRGEVLPLFGVPLPFCVRMSQTLSYNNYKCYVVSDSEKKKNSWPDFKLPPEKDKEADVSSLSPSPANPKTSSSLPFLPWKFDLNLLFLFQISVS